MTHKLTLLVTLPIVAGLVAACGGGGSRSEAPKVTQLRVPQVPKLVPIHVPPASLGGFDEDVPGGVLNRTHTAAGPLFNSKYGLFVRDTAVGGYAKAKLTPPSQMPRDVTATYKGSFVGFDGVESHERERIGGDVRLRADFGAGTVNGKVSNLRNTNGASKSYGLSMNGKISGSKYLGNTGFTTKSGAPAGTVTSSDFKGAFAGRNASETVGSLHVIGTPGAGQPSKAVVGAFGAKKQ